MKALELFSPEEMLSYVSEGSLAASSKYVLCVLFNADNYPALYIFDIKDVEKYWLDICVYATYDWDQIRSRVFKFPLLVSCGNLTAAEFLTSKLVVQPYINEGTVKYLLKNALKKTSSVETKEAMLSCKFLDLDPGYIPYQNMTFLQKLGVKFHKSVEYAPDKNYWAGMWNFRKSIAKVVVRQCARADFA